MLESVDITGLLRQSQGGDARALEKVFEVLYTSLRSLARDQLRREAEPRTLTPTALVNEAFLQIYGGTPPAWESKRHLMGVTVRAMRQVLVDHARRRNALKRPQASDRIDITDITSSLACEEVDMVKLDGVLDRLAEVDARQASIVELRFFGGLSVDEIAEQMEISPRTVGREWRMARAWLRRELDNQ